MTEKQTIQFNGQEWEEITREEFLNVETRNHLSYRINGISHYYRLIPKEVFPKIFGDFKVDEEGQLIDDFHGGYRILACNDKHFSDLKLALEESERIRSK